MNLDNLINFFLSLNTWMVVKIFVLFALLVYICFAFILVKQVYLMTQVVHSSLDTFLKTISILLLFLAVGVFFATLVFL